MKNTPTIIGLMWIIDRFRVLGLLVKYNIPVWINNNYYPIVKPITHRPKPTN